MTQQWTEAGTSKFVTIREGDADLNIHYNDTEAGDEVVVMLHGSGPGASGWANFNRNIQPLTDAGYRVILMDCPGWSKSDTIVNDGSRSHLNARVLKGLVDALGLNKIHIIGNSMGGHSAVAFTLEYPEHVDKLILMGGGTGGGSLFTPMPAERIKRIGKLYREPNMDNLKVRMDLCVCDTRKLTEELLQTRLDNMLGRKDRLGCLVTSSSASPKRFPDVGHGLGENKTEPFVVGGRDAQF